MTKSRNKWKQQCICRNYDTRCSFFTPDYLANTGRTNCFHETPEELHGRPPDSGEWWNGWRNNPLKGGKETGMACFKCDRQVVCKSLPVTSEPLQLASQLSWAELYTVASHSKLKIFHVFLSLKGSGLPQTRTHSSRNVFTSLLYQLCFGRAATLAPLWILNL